LSALFLLGTLVPKAYATDTVIIGIDLPLTGPYSSLGVDSLAGAQLLESQISEKGGILFNLSPSTTLLQSKNPSVEL